MRYRLELEIESARDRVVTLFLDPDNLARWQSSLVSFEPLDGENPRQVGARSRQVHKMGRRQVEMIETITVHDYPDKFSATYEADGARNLIDNQFVDIGERRTKWVLDSEFRCNGVMMKIMAFCLPGMFRKQTMTCMEQFKEFAESASD